MKPRVAGEEKHNSKVGCSSPVVMSADLMAAGLQSRCSALMSAATPATWGVEMDVPESMLNSRPGNSLGSGPPAAVQAARMRTPGAVRSGCKRSGLRGMNEIWCWLLSALAKIPTYLQDFVLQPIGPVSGESRDNRSWRKVELGECVQ